jgi:hypothetical protein
MSPHCQRPKSQKTARLVCPIETQNKREKLRLKMNTKQRGQSVLFNTISGIRSEEVVVPREGGDIIAEIGGAEVHDEKREKKSNLNCTIYNKQQHQQNITKHSLQTLA